MLYVPRLRIVGIDVFRRAFIWGTSGWLAVIPFPFSLCGLP